MSSHESNGTGKKTSRLLLSAALLGGWAAGALTAAFIVRREIGKLQPGAPKPQAKKEDAPATAVAPVPVPQAAAPVAAQNGNEEPSEEVLTIISAAVAAFLGKTARIRSVRMVSGGAQSSWAQQGRVFVQASHNLGALQR